MNELTKTTSLLNARSVGLMGAFDMVVPKTRHPNRPVTGQAGSKLARTASTKGAHLDRVADDSAGHVPGDLGRVPSEHEGRAAAVAFDPGSRHSR